MISRKDLALISEAIDLSSAFVKALKYATIKPDGTILVYFDEDDEGYSQIKRIAMQGGIQ